MNFYTFIIQKKFMGLTIHYSGSFNKGASLPAMIEEVKDIISVYKWPFDIYEGQFPPGSFGKKSYDENIYGISFTPPECETVSLCFLSNGKMSSPFHLEFYGNSANKEEQKYLYMLFVKTQYAGAAIHKLIIHLLKYLDKKYFTNFKVTDEGEYWETGDEHLLQEIFNRYTNLINSFSTAIETFPPKAGENFENYFIRLMKWVDKKNKE